MWIGCAGKLAGWGCQVPKFSFYNLEQNGQAVIARIDLILDDDATAIACAEQLIVGEEIQVWEGSRLVACLPSTANERSIDERSIDERSMALSQAEPMNLV
jgi:hypothetical protein